MDLNSSSNQNLDLEFSSEIRNRDVSTHELTLACTSFLVRRKHSVGDSELRLGLPIHSRTVAGKLNIGDWAEPGNYCESRNCSFDEFIAGRLADHLLVINPNGYVRRPGMNQSTIST